MPPPVVAAAMEQPTEREWATFRAIEARQRLRDPHRRLREYTERHGNKTRMAILARTLKNQTRYRWAQRVLAPTAVVTDAMARRLLRGIRRWPRDYVARQQFNWRRPRQTPQDCFEAFMTLCNCTNPSLGCACWQCRAVCQFACLVVHGHSIMF